MIAGRLVKNMLAAGSSLGMHHDADADAWFVVWELGGRRVEATAPELVVALTQATQQAACPACPACVRLHDARSLITGDVILCSCGMYLGVRHCDGGRTVLDLRGRSALGRAEPLG